MGARTGLFIQDNIVHNTQYPSVRKNNGQTVQSGQPAVGHDA